MSKSDEAILNRIAKIKSKGLSISIQGNNYYVLRGTGPMDFVQLMTFKRPATMSDLGAFNLILRFLDYLG